MIRSMNDVLDLLDSRVLRLYWVFLSWEVEKVIESDSVFEPSKKVIEKQTDQGPMSSLYEFCVKHFEIHPDIPLKIESIKEEPTFEEKMSQKIYGW